MATIEEYRKYNFSISDLTDYSAFANVLSWNKNATDKEIETIVSISKEVWLKDENGYSLDKFVDFLSEHYFNNEITLEDIKKASKWDILNDVVNDRLYEMINDKTNDEMEHK